MAGPLLAKKTIDKLSARTHPSYEVLMMILTMIDDGHDDDNVDDSDDDV